MKKFLAETYLWILLLPVMLYVAGVGCNQAVFAANHDRFPVMWNAYEVNRYALELEKVARGDDEDAAFQAQFDLIALDSGYIDSIHVLMTGKTKLNFLADWIDFRAAMFSPGDLLILAFRQVWGPVFYVWIALLCLKVYSLTR